MSLQGKTAIVTGGSRGIGAGIAKELSKRGARVLITYASSSSKADEVVDSIKSSGGEAIAIKADCVSLEAPKLVAEAAAKFDGNGGFDIIVNNAGAGDEMWLKDVTYEHFDKIFHTNVRFPMFLMKESLPFIRREGRVVNLGSVIARQGWKMHTAYGASKACLESFSKTWAVELGHEHGITVNTVNPGPVATDMWDAMPANIIREFDGYIAQTPAEPRVATVDDIVQIVAFLCEEGSRWVTGRDIDY
ncbi:hydroxynaphthalene reductase Arp2 [Hyphodiscus hymeniophilus]|uniref:Hydroxynaphthalene reductase Arp2 n=1 Tax=Hyphodiscus hymeniophilus TaxID=353542 RepID=A0A9P7AU98_9HELO|nr:hydroxynaphthalene reductase Arp2 [Hyphodiscus hymeniophilus]